MDMRHTNATGVGRKPRRSTHGPPTAIAVRDWGEELMVYTGLSVTLHGHRIDVVRDHGTQVAEVRVKPVGAVVTGKAEPTEEVARDLQEAASLLADRAQRFLGGHWKVVHWDGCTGDRPQAAAQPELVADTRRAGVYQEGSGV